MSNIREIKNIDRGQQCQAVLRKFADEHAENCDVVLILAIDKQGGQHLLGNDCSHMERSFLFTFFQAFMTRWFNLGGDQ